MQAPSKTLSLAVIVLAIIPAAIVMTLSVRANTAELRAYQVHLAQEEGAGDGVWAQAQDEANREMVRQAQTMAAKNAIREIGVNLFPGVLFNLTVVGAALASMYRTRSYLWAAAAGVGCLVLAGVHVFLLHGSLMDVMVAMENTGLWGEVTQNVSIPVSRGLVIGLPTTAVSAGFGVFLGSVAGNLADSSGMDTKVPEYDVVASFIPTAQEMGLEDPLAPIGSTPPQPEPEPEPEVPSEDSVADQLPPAPMPAQVAEPAAPTPEPAAAAPQDSQTAGRRVAVSCPSCGAGNAPVNSTCIVCGTGLATAT